MQIKFPVLRLVLTLVCGLLVGCTVIAVHQFDKEYGPAQVQSRVSSSPHPGPSFKNVIKPILDNRCVVCHACYDAPCQLKLSSIEGIDRGANKTEVYDGERLLATAPTRLYIDAQNTNQWRAKKFYPILNERAQSPDANLELSTLYQVLRLKRVNPLPETAILPDDFDFALDRSQQCPTIEEFAFFSKLHPTWGMPYGLPQLSDKEFNAIVSWIRHGAKAEPIAKPDQKAQIHIKRWEEFFNGTSNKERLMSRYIYEHLFLGHLYFSELSNKSFYKIVRSTTPPGEDIVQIPTRRPYESPGEERFYYRLWPERSTISVKTHMPYALNSSRMKRWKELFLEPAYTVSSLPSYEIKVAANPFITFKDIPVNSRYRFMLDEAEFTINGFIKGPVCRGRLALNVIEDRFWVLFINPDSKQLEHEGQFISRHRDDLSLPTQEDSNALPIKTWLTYSKRHQEYLMAKEQYLSKVFKNSRALTLDLIWDGDKSNENASLTIFRHVDAATVVKGLVGEVPKTAWVIGYNLLERIHYLLVAGFDVFGNLGHQLNARLYMDFLRMEGEFNFLSLLPPDFREIERDQWYRDAPTEVEKYIKWPDTHLRVPPAIPYKTNEPKKEIFSMMRSRLGSALSLRYSSNSRGAQYPKKLIKLLKLSGARGTYVRFLPQLSFVRVKGRDKTYTATIIHDNGYSNVSTPLFESYRRLPIEDEVTIVPGLLGAYPNAFFDLEESQLPAFVRKLRAIGSEEDYRKFYGRFGIRRTDKYFWEFSDWLHQRIKAEAPLEAGIFDYSRFENR